MDNLSVGQKQMTERFKSNIKQVLLEVFAWSLFSYFYFKYFSSVS